MRLSACTHFLSEFLPCVFSSGVKEDRISTVEMLLSTLQTKVRLVPTRVPFVAAVSRASGPASAMRGGAVSWAERVGSSVKAEGAQTTERSPGLERSVARAGCESLGPVMAVVVLCAVSRVCYKHLGGL